MDIGQCQTKIKNCPAKWKTYRTFCLTGKIRVKIKCVTRLCFCSTINWRYPTKLLILSNKYLWNKSFLINKLQYLKYCFLQKPLYQKTLQKYNSKSFIFMSSPANKQTNKQTKTLNFKIVFWAVKNEQFMIPSKEAGMKVSILDLFYVKKIFYRLVEYAKKNLSLPGVCI